MISKIIQKEKERQEEYLRLEKEHDRVAWLGEINSHEQSLINLKEYLEEELEYHRQLNLIIITEEISGLYDLRQMLEENIKELTKMIKRYD